MSEANIRPGDKVILVTQDIDELKLLLENHGGWFKQLPQIGDKVGRVLRYHDEDLKVQFNPEDFDLSGVRRPKKKDYNWVFPEYALKRVDITDSSSGNASARDTERQTTENSSPTNTTTAETESNIKCKICYERNFNIVFSPCGHTSCETCFQKLKEGCHICREKITRHINVFY
uniref:E3 ubiquitin-protein ligase SP1-like n=1 Tax=Ciona intestinalis TaxID=7719 RepID=F6SRP3_CIOIN|nr:E3 ubiquitin-protein ligase SP1-like [Ciona intestinalis]|eukprot:XP_002128925.1 E3 ubiquitin-protein ligase SP1-like [Ciona intestinalis]